MTPSLGQHLSENSHVDTTSSMGGADGDFRPRGGGEWIGRLGTFLPYFSIISMQKMPPKGRGAGAPLASLLIYVTE